MRQLSMLNMGIDTLSDDDPLNDAFAWSYLSCVFLALGDTSRKKTCTVACLNLNALSDLESEKQEVDPAKVKASGDRDSSDTVAKDNEHSAETQSREDKQTKDASMKDESTKHELTETQPTEDQPDGCQDSEASNTTFPIPRTGLQPGTSIVDKKMSRWFYCDGPCSDNLPPQQPFYRCRYCNTDFCQSCHDLTMSGQNIHWNICGTLHEHVLIPGIQELFPEKMMKADDEFVDFDVWMA